MKIASWNINSVRFRIEIVEQFLREESPDILCLQETKVIDGDFPARPFRKLGYDHVIIHGQKMHHGVAIISRVPLVEMSSILTSSGQERCSCSVTSIFTGQRNPRHGGRRSG